MAATLWLILIACVAAVGAVVYRLVNIIKTRGIARRSNSKQTAPPIIDVLVVLGSGGHTSEMISNLTLLGSIWGRHYRPHYFLSDSDHDSEAVARNFQARFSTPPPPNVPYTPPFTITRIPRARNVGQSYLSSIPTTLHAFIYSIRAVYSVKARLILVNGPGVCVPVVAAALLFTAIGLLPRPAIGYFESFTCVDHLSLSGKILQYVADVFTVQWPPLLSLLLSRQPPQQQQPPKDPSSESHSSTCWKLVGPLATAAEVAAAGDDSKPPSQLSRLPPPQGSGLAIVTVGSTKFDALIKAIDISVLTALKQHGIHTLLVQKGRTDVEMDPAITRAAVAAATDASSSKEPAMNVQVVEYRPQLASIIREADILISHAGAGTVLDALGARTRSVIVPNPLLMNNHQTVFASELQQRHFIVCCSELGATTTKSIGSGGKALAASVERAFTEELVCFPQPSEAAFGDAFDKLKGLI